jgi:hypothetical protein
MPYLDTRIKHAAWQQKFALGMYPPPADKKYTTQKEYRYKLIGPESQVDPVLVGIKTTVQTLEQENMDVATVAIKVQNLTLSPPIWPLQKKNKDINVKMYAFRLGWDEFPYAAPVSIADRDKKGILSPDRILVRDEGKWLPVKEWLTDLAVYGHPWLTDLEAHQMWWKKREQNGKSFQFNGLPGELQLQILQHALGTNISPSVENMRTSSEGDFAPHVVLGSIQNRRQWLNQSSLGDGSGFDRVEYQKRVENTPFPNLAVLLVNKQMRRDALKAGWVGTVKYFSSHTNDFRGDWGGSWGRDSHFKNVLECSKAPTPMNWLSRIHLDLTIKEYFAILGVTVTPAIHLNQEHCTMKLLQGITTLTHLSLQFPDPHRTSTSDNPWYDFLVESTGYTGASKSGACWKVLIDWILTFAFPLVKHVPNIQLHGCIKTATKYKWTRIFDAEYDERELPLDRNRTHSFDYDEVLKTILEFPVHCL